MICCCWVRNRMNRPLILFPLYSSTNVFIHEWTHFRLIISWHRIKGHFLLVYPGGNWQKLENMWTQMWVNRLCVHGFGCVSNMSKASSLERGLSTIMHTNVSKDDSLSVNNNSIIQVDYISINSNTPADLCLFCCCLLYLFSQTLTPGTMINNHKPWIHVFFFFPLSKISKAEYLIDPHLRL